MLDYIIVGQGIAGSLLAYELLQANKKVLVLNDESLPSSSQVAGGMFNPVTGRHLAKTWLADELFPFLKTYYPEIEQRFNAKFFHQTGLFRPYVNEKQRTQFQNAILKHEIAHYVSDAKDFEKMGQFIANDLGGLQTADAGWVDVPELLKTLKSHFIASESYANEAFNYDELKVKPENVIYKSYEAKSIIFCEGFHAKNNPFFNWLPFNPVKGETLLVESPDYAVTEIVNQGSWVIPLAERKCRFGATYSWHDLDFEITEKARATLQEKIGKFFKSDYRIISQQAGVRPSTTDRRPFLGKHPEYINIYIFNGLGTKGVSIAPFFARQFRDFLLQGKEINSETTIERFYTLY
ncbi:MAG: FAD-binding oxidoreductase [Spirosomaceae bacterium]|nr:FAD-binding oxidoreductase [Spirosomataceae bacterium]